MLNFFFFVCLSLMSQERFQLFPISYNQPRLLEITFIYNKLVTANACKGNAILTIAFSVNIMRN